MNEKEEKRREKKEEKNGKKDLFEIVILNEVNRACFSSYSLR